MEWMLAFSLCAAVGCQSAEVDEDERLPVAKIPRDREPHTVVVAKNREVASVEVSITEYLEHKKNGLVKEVWVERTTVVAEMYSGYIRDGQPYKWIRAEVPPAYLENPEGFKELSKGIEPSRFHYKR